MLKKIFYLTFFTLSILEISLPTRAIAMEKVNSEEMNLKEQIIRANYFIVPINLNNIQPVKLSKASLQELNSFKREVSTIENSEPLNTQESGWIFGGDFSKALINDPESQVVRFFEAKPEVVSSLLKRIFVAECIDATLLVRISFGLRNSPPEEVQQELEKQKLGVYDKFFGDCVIKDKSQFDKFFAIFVQAELIPAEVAEKILQKIKTETLSPQELKTYNNYRNLLPKGRPSRVTNSISYIIADTSCIAAKKPFTAFPHIVKDSDYTSATSKIEALEERKLRALVKTLGVNINRHLNGAGKFNSP